jgi:hypothetical protein
MLAPKTTTFREERKGKGKEEEEEKEPGQRQ